MSNSIPPLAGLAALIMGAACDVAEHDIGSDAGTAGEVEAEVAGSSTKGGWGPVIETPVNPIHTILLPNKRVLMCGRREPWHGGVGVNSLQQCRSWNLGADFAPTGTATDIFCSGHSRLANGSVLFVGGHKTCATQALDKVATENADCGGYFGVPNINSYTTDGRWLAKRAMNSPRWYPTATTLGNGKVLVTGGTIDAVALGEGIPDVYDPATDTIQRLTGANKPFFFYPWMHLLSNGQVFNAGPTKQTCRLNTGGDGSWSNCVNTRVGLRDYGSSVMYDVDKVLISGGGGDPDDLPMDEAGKVTNKVRASAERIHLSTANAQWEDAGEMTSPRRHHTLTVLPDGKVIATGGHSHPSFNGRGGAPEADAVMTVDIYSPSANTWAAGAAMSVPRQYHSTALLVPDGRVLVAGGGADSFAPDRPSAQFYYPPYLFKTSGQQITDAERPKITAGDATVAYGAKPTYTIADGNVTKVTLIRMGAVTHAYNQDQRFTNLTFTKTGNNVKVNMPCNANAMPPGHYLMFAHATVGGTLTPSKGYVVQLTGTSCP